MYVYTERVLETNSTAGPLMIVRDNDLSIETFHSVYCPL